ncbi:MAG: GNAT family N-acetyltransferase [Oscillospiraceae bacterium]|jgi:putative acetyltransferase|nr:GNAT family N-acetyltransferase [Oscillospiraceae bacterium]
MNFYIRPVKASDAAGTNELRRMPGIVENINALPSERPDAQEDFISAIGRDAHMFVAVEPNGAIIGMTLLNVRSTPRTRHIGDISFLIVHPDFQNMGIGTSLMKTLTDMADKYLMLERMGVTSLVDNESAIKLYKKFGFKIEGRQRHAIIQNGEYADVYIMGRIRNEISDFFDSEK